MRRLPRRAWVLFALAVLLNGPPAASADTVSCEECIKLYSCDTDITHCAAQCQVLYPDAAFSQLNCIDICNRTLDSCVQQATYECARLRKCP